MIAPLLRFGSIKKKTEDFANSATPSENSATVQSATAISKQTTTKTPNRN
jgi:hypothetical protein